MTETVYKTDRLVIRIGDCLEVMRKRLSDASIDSIVTDPDYGLVVSRKSAGWGGPPQVEWARECLRVLKPGGHLLVFGGTRTWHRLAVAVEDAGFEIRDSIAWIFGSGFPKSLDISKAIDKAAGAQREVIGSGANRGVTRVADGKSSYGDFAGSWDVTAPATDLAQQWSGWGSALKPGFEPILAARKPLDGTLVGNVLTHGTGALNIDGCRIETTDNLNGGTYSAGNYNGSAIEGTGRLAPGAPRLTGQYVQPSGRWPANVVLDEVAAAGLDEQTGVLKSGMVRAGTKRAEQDSDVYRQRNSDTTLSDTYADSGGASRFFYCAKAPQSERPRTWTASCNCVTLREWSETSVCEECGVPARKNSHSTVKPLTLMRWLTRLVTPPGGLILDPFLGTGTTAQAALLEGFRCYGIENDPDCWPLICQRLNIETDESPLLAGGDAK